MKEQFSGRYGYKSGDAEIAIREDAPEDLRFAVVQIARDAGMTPSSIRDIICPVLLAAPDRSNWSEYPNIWDEVQNHLRDCDWFKVYDIYGVQLAWVLIPIYNETDCLLYDAASSLACKPLPTVCNS